MRFSKKMMTPIQNKTLNILHADSKGDVVTTHHEFTTSLPNPVCSWYGDGFTTHIWLHNTFNTNTFPMLCNKRQTTTNNKSLTTRNRERAREARERAISSQTSYPVELSIAKSHTRCSGRAKHREEPHTPWSSEQSATRLLFSKAMWRL